MKDVGNLVLQVLQYITRTMIKQKNGTDLDAEMEFMMLCTDVFGNLPSGDYIRRIVVNSDGERMYDQSTSFHLSSCD